MGIPNKIQFTWAPVNSSPSAESGRFRFPAVSWGLKKQRIVSHIGLDKTLQLTSETLDQEYIAIKLELDYF
jgi:hypothetical protein